LPLVALATALAAAVRRFAHEALALRLSASEAGPHTPPFAFPRVPQMPVNGAQICALE